MTTTQESGKHHRQTLDGNPLDQNYRDILNTVAFVEEHVPFNRLPFTQNRDRMTLLELILNELQLSPGHFYVANDEKDNNGWVAVVVFDEPFGDTDDRVIMGTGDTAIEAIESIGNKLKEIYG